MSQGRLEERLTISKRELARLLRELKNGAPPPPCS